MDQKNEIKDGMLFVKMKQSLADDIISYLDEKPIKEVGMYCSVIETVMNQNQMFSWNFIMDLVQYFAEKCPRKEVKHLIKRMIDNNPDTGEIEIYKATLTDEKNEQE